MSRWSRPRGRFRAVIAAWAAAAALARAASTFKGSSYQTPGWQRAQGQAQNAQSGGTPASGSGTFGANTYGGNASGGAARQKWPDKKPARGPLLIEGQVVASSRTVSEFKTGDRVFHEKFGYGAVSAVDGNKLTVDFEKAGEKKVVDSFVERG